METDRERTEGHNNARPVGSSQLATSGRPGPLCCHTPPHYCLRFRQNQSRHCFPCRGAEPVHPGKRDTVTVRKVPTPHGHAGSLRAARAPAARQALPPPADVWPVARSCRSQRVTGLLSRAPVCLTTVLARQATGKSPLRGTCPGSRTAERAVTPAPSSRCNRSPERDWPQRSSRLI